MNTTLATRREWLGLAVLALPTLLLSVDVSVLYLALPHLSTDLGADSTQQLWILDIYSFMLAGFLVTMGTLGDRIGRRRLLLIGAAAFGVTSVVAAPPAAAEDAARQGITAATSAAQDLPGALAADLLDVARTAFTAGLTTVAGIGAAVFLGLAVLAAVAFRHVPATGAAPEVPVGADQAPDVVTVAA